MPEKIRSFLSQHNISPETAILIIVASIIVVSWVLSSLKYIVGIAAIYLVYKAYQHFYRRR